MVALGYGRRVQGVTKNMRQVAKALLFE